VPVLPGVGFAAARAAGGVEDGAAVSELPILATGGCLPEREGVLHLFTRSAVTRIKKESSAAVPIRASRLIRSRAPGDWPWLSDSLVP
jgi:hypothetical protein